MQTQVKVDAHRDEKLIKLHAEVSKYFDIEPGYEVKEKMVEGFSGDMDMKIHYVAFQMVGMKKGYCVNITIMVEEENTPAMEYDLDFMMFQLTALTLTQKKK